MGSQTPALYAHVFTLEGDPRLPFDRVYDVETVHPLISGRRCMRTLKQSAGDGVEAIATGSSFSHLM
jgi:hypothetical protein